MIALASLIGRTLTDDLMDALKIAFHEVHVVRPGEGFTHSQGRSRAVLKVDANNVILDVHAE
jgi:hypothetical protein